MEIEAQRHNRRDLNSYFMFAHPACFASHAQCTALVRSVFGECFLRFVEYFMSNLFEINVRLNGGRYHSFYSLQLCQKLSTLPVHNFSISDRPTLFSVNDFSRLRRTQQHRTFSKKYSWIPGTFCKIPVVVHYVHVVHYRSAVIYQLVQLLDTKKTPHVSIEQLLVRRRYRWSFCFYCIILDSSFIFSIHSKSKSGEGEQNWRSHACSLHHRARIKKRGLRTSTRSDWHDQWG
mmetsp:Transcript_6216/g.7606  ORF Transcript_6216/g.7606 Transcript_6216/m.7606 type:complete len:233 (+) Transcript_6216:65-763(+)